MPTEHPEPGFFKKVWLHIGPSTVVIVGEYARFFMLLALTALAYLFLKGYRQMGYPAARVEVFETMDYWTVLVLLAEFFLSLIYRVGIILFTTTKRT